MLIKNGKRVHAAINIYAEDETYDEIVEQARILDELGVDGIIMSDGCVIDAVRKAAPHTDVHISTQANTVSYHAANFWYKNGAKRVILGREMNKEQIRTLIQNKPEDLEVEIFCHGAICFAYSGRCFLSEFLAGRNGNLGDCAQSCRWAYNVYVEETNNPGELMPVETDEKGTYIFSSKDMCLIKEIPEIIEMGVNSVKIEGRLKTEYYLASVDTLSELPIYTIKSTDESKSDITTNQNLQSITYDAKKSALYGASRIEGNLTIYKLALQEGDSEKTYTFNLDLGDSVIFSNFYCMAVYDEKAYFAIKYIDNIETIFCITILIL